MAWELQEIPEVTTGVITNRFRRRGISWSGREDLNLRPLAPHAFHDCNGVKVPETIKP